MIVDPAHLVSRARTIGRFAVTRIAQQRDREFIRRTKLVREGMKLPTLPSLRRAPGTVWAVTMVKNEADIIEASVRHLFDQGITAAIVADNGSTDQTPNILRRLGRELPVYLATDAEAAYYQGSKMSLLADCARRAGADWVIPFDADEFWFAPTGTVASWLQTVRADVVSAQVYNVFPSSSAPSGWVMDLQPHMNPKVAFRAVSGAVLTVGNHRVSHPGHHTDGLFVAHQPWRSFEQFGRKLRDGASALEQAQLHPAEGAHWRASGHLDDDALRTVWVNLTDGVDVPSLGWSPIGQLKEVGPHARGWNPAQRATPPHRAAANAHVFGYAVPSGDQWDDVTTAARALANREGAHLEVMSAAGRSLRARARELVRPTARPQIVLAARAGDLVDAVRRWPQGTFSAAWVMTDDGDDLEIGELRAGMFARLVVPTRHLAERLRAVSLSEPTVVPWRSDVRGVRLPAARPTDVLVVNDSGAPVPDLPPGLITQIYTPRLLTVYDRRRELRSALAASKCVIAAKPRVLAEAADLGSIALPTSKATASAVEAAVNSWTPTAAHERWLAATTNPDGGMIERVANALNG